MVERTAGGAYIKRAMLSSGGEELALISGDDVKCCSQFGRGLIFTLRLPWRESGHPNPGIHGRSSLNPLCDFEE